MALTFTGVSQTQQRLSHLRDRPIHEAPALLTDVGWEIINAALPLTPILTGAMRASRLVWPPEVMAAHVSITVSFGNAATPYTIRQHEDLSLVHRGSTQAKFLEMPFNAIAVQLDHRLARWVRGWMR